MTNGNEFEKSKEESRDEAQKAKLGNLGTFKGVSEEVNPLMVIGVSDSGKTYVEGIKGVMQNKKRLCVEVLADALKIVAALPPIRNRILRPRKGAFGG